MGGGHGIPSGNSRYSQVLHDNLLKIASTYQLSPGGYFGTRGTTGRVRRIESDNPLGTARLFFSTLTRGARVEAGPKAGLTRANFPDGSAMSIRLASRSDGSPVVQIQLSGRRYGVAPAQKIHFVPRGTAK